MAAPWLSGDSLHLRLLRGGGAFVGVFLFLYIVIASGLTRTTEVSWAVPFGMIAVSLMLSVGAIGRELAAVGEVGKRDRLFGFAAGIFVFAVLRIAKLL